MIITVTESDIINGKRRDEYDCPIALAIKRARQTNNVIVNQFSVVINSIKYLFPYEAYSFLLRFDGHILDYEKKIKPFQFDLLNETERQISNISQMTEEEKIEYYKKERIKRENNYNNLNEELPGSDDYQQTPKLENEWP